LAFLVKISPKKGNLRPTSASNNWKRKSGKAERFAMNCKKDKETVSRYLSDLMDPAERAEFEAHLAECGDCRAEAERLRRMLVLLGDMPREMAPLSVARAIDQAADSHFRAVRRPVSFSARWLAVTRVAAAAVIVFAVLFAAYFAIFAPGQDQKGVPPEGTNVAVKPSGQEGSPRDRESGGFSAPSAARASGAAMDDLNVFSRMSIDDVRSEAGQMEFVQLIEVLKKYGPLTAAEVKTADGEKQAAVNAAKYAARLKVVYAVALEKAQNENDFALIESVAAPRAVMDRGEGGRMLEGAAGGEAKAAAGTMREENAVAPEVRAQKEADEVLLLKKQSEELQQKAAALQSRLADLSKKREEEKADAERDKIDTEIASTTAELDSVKKQISETQTQQKQAEAAKIQAEATQPHPGEAPGTKSPSEAEGKDAKKEALAIARPVPVFRQSVIVRSAVEGTPLAKEQRQALLSLLQPFCKNEIGGKAEAGLTLQLSDEELARLLEKIAEIKGIAVSLGPLTVGFQPAAQGEKTALSKDDALDHLEVPAPAGDSLEKTKQVQPPRTEISIRIE
jgi:hypothetical protein